MKLGPRYLLYGIVTLALVGIILLANNLKTEDEEYNPIINPSDFVNKINNPYYSLIPGTIFEYESETDEGMEKNVVIVTNKSREILGIKETYDWYAQDSEGNVWYLGEDSREYENGKVASTKGSWEAGIDGAKPGIIMKANPKIGDSYRQEYYKGEAEDMADVVSLGESVEVPYGIFNNCIKTRDWSKIDSKQNEHKYYCPKIGAVVLEISIESGERVDLVNFTKGNI